MIDIVKVAINPGQLQLSQEETVYPRRLIGFAPEVQRVQYMQYDRICIYIFSLMEFKDSVFFLFFFCGAEPDCPLNISPTFSTLIQALSPFPLSHPLSFSQCQWQGLLHEQTASALGANFSQLWGCGEQPFISGKQTRPITSSGGWCGQGGRGTGGDRQVFTLLLLFQSQSHPNIRAHAHAQTPIGAHTHSVT